ncbi:MAG: EamA family transporter [Chromatiales bacterium]|nr:EamA family transporter [Chromatiales bacterium]
MRPIELFQTLAVVVIWGLNFVVIKTAVSEIPPLALTALRFALVAALLTPFFHLARAQLRPILGLALVMGLGHFGMLFVGLRGADAATSALMIQLGVPFSAILAAIFFSDRLGWIRGLGMGLAFAGAALLAGEPQGGAIWALGALLISAFCWAWANILIKRLPSLHPLTIIGWMSLFAVPILLVLSTLLETGQLTAIQAASWKAWGSLAYIVLASSLIAYYLWYRLITRLDVNQVVPFTLLAPVIGVFAGVLLLDETLTLFKAVGGLLTISGVALIQVRQARKREIEPATDSK